MPNFSEFNLDEKILKKIQEMGFSETTKIQSKAIPLVQAGKDVSGLAQTGTGKTAAFLIPTLQRLYATWGEQQREGVKPFENWSARSTVLILVPTRELAEQVSTNLKELSDNETVSYVTVYGGVAYEKQKALLEKGATFIIATPGRLIDLYKEKFFDPKQVKSVIFDEADRMFDMGFKDDMKFLLDRIPRDRQFLVFSATLNFDVLRVAYEYGSDPVEIEIDRSLPRTDQVKDEVLHVGQNEKPMFLMSLLKSKDFDQAIVFTNFVRNVPRIEKFLQMNGFKALGISSALSQSHRTKVMESFRNGETNILVATDVAARGLDIDNVDIVVNYELPDDSENYVHRIGRTGRAGRDGLAFSLSSEKDVEALKRLESFLKSKLVIGWLEDSALVKDFKPFPYTFDPQAKIKDLSGRNNKKDTRPPRKKTYSNHDSSYKDSLDAESSQRNSKKYKKSGEFKKRNPDSKSNGKFSSRSNAAATAKAQTSTAFKTKKAGEKGTVPQKTKKRKSSSRYKNFKTVASHSSSKKGFISKILGLFSN